jgi:hypothetical protein
MPIKWILRFHTSIFTFPSFCYSNITLLPISTQTGAHPLIQAVLQDNLDIVKLLLIFGSDPLRVNEELVRTFHN